MSMINSGNPCQNVLYPDFENQVLLENKEMQRNPLPIQLTITSLVKSIFNSEFYDPGYLDEKLTKGDIQTTGLKKIELDLEALKNYKTRLKKVELTFSSGSLAISVITIVAMVALIHLHNLPNPAVIVPASCGGLFIYLVLFFCMQEKIQSKIKEASHQISKEQEFINLIKNEKNLSAFFNFLEDAPQNKYSLKSLIDLYEKLQKKEQTIQQLESQLQHLNNRILEEHNNLTVH